MWRIIGGGYSGGLFILTFVAGGRDLSEKAVSVRERRCFFRV
jgi:hypothetical protein